jgi:putative PIN family toxin of toxin-antitoxin system
MRVMLDTNILISSFIFKSSKINELINELSKNHEIVICSYVIEELKELISSKFIMKEECLDNFLKEFPYDLVYSPTNVDGKMFKIRDDDDYIILYTAIIENVDILITGDKDFFDIKIDKPEIMTVNDFLKQYKK